MPALGLEETAGALDEVDPADFALPEAGFLAGAFLCAAGCDLCAGAEALCVGAAGAVTDGGMVVVGAELD